jgi:hypothetical protein
LLAVLPLLSCHALLPYEPGERQETDGRAADGAQDAPGLVDKAMVPPDTMTPDAQAIATDLSGCPEQLLATVPKTGTATDGRAGLSDVALLVGYPASSPCAQAPAMVGSQQSHSDGATGQYLFTAANDPAFGDVAQCVTNGTNEMIHMGFQYVSTGSGTTSGSYESTKLAGAPDLVGNTLTSLRLTVNSLSLSYNPTQSQQSVAYDVVWEFFGVPGSC